MKFDCKCCIWIPLHARCSTEILFYTIQLSYNELDINYLRRRCFQADFRSVLDSIAFVPFSSTVFPLNGFVL